MGKYMMLIEQAQIADQDLPIAEFQAHLAMGTALDPDGVQIQVLAGFLRAAIAAIETKLGKILLQRDFEWHPTRVQDRIALPVGPILRVTQVDHIDGAGTAQVVDPNSYDLDRSGDVVVLTGAARNLPKNGAISVYFSAGITDTWARLPADLAQAVFMLAAHYYEYRHDMGLSAGCMPFGVTSLIQRFRRVRLGSVGGHA